MQFGGGRDRGLLGCLLIAEPSAHIRLAGVHRRGVVRRRLRLFRSASTGGAAETPGSPIATPRAPGGLTPGPPAQPSRPRGLGCLGRSTPLPAIGREANRFQRGAQRLPLTTPLFPCGVIGQRIGGVRYGDPFGRAVRRELDGLRCDAQRLPIAAALPPRGIIRWRVEGMNTGAAGLGGPAPRRAPGPIHWSAAESSSPSSPYGSSSAGSSVPGVGCASRPPGSGARVPHRAPLAQALTCSQGTVGCARR